MGTKVWRVATLLVGLLWPCFGLGADWSVVPSVNAKIEFNSNLNNSFTNKISDYIFSLSPVAEFNYATEISKIQGRLGLTGMHYLRHGEIDHVDQNFQINGEYRISPRWNLTMRGVYIVDTTLVEELAASGLIMNRTPRKSMQLGPGVTYNITERLAANLNYTFNQVNYQDPRFRNYTSQMVGLKFEYPLKNQRTVLISNILGRETTYPGNDNYRSMGVYLGANHKFSEKWEVNLLAGVNISNLDFSTQVLDTSQGPIIVRQARLRKTEATPFFNLSTIRRWTNFTFSAGFSRDESPSASASISSVSRVFGTAAYSYSDRLTGVLNGGYSISNQVSQQNNLETDYFNISPQINYRITEKLTASPGYSFGLRNDVTNDRTANVHSAWLMLTYSYPIHYQK